MLRAIRELHPERGFTLIELIMTIIVVGIVAIPLSLLITEHLQSVVVSKDHTLARDLAQFEMEKVNNMNYANIISANSSDYLGYGYDITRTVTYAQGNATTPESLKQIQVDVTEGGGSQVLFSLTTYLTNHVNYGL